MSLTGDQIRAIDARVEARFNDLVNLGKLTALGTVVDVGFVGASPAANTTAMVSIDGSKQAVPVKVFRSCRIAEGDRVGLVKMYGYWHVFANYDYRQWTTARFVNEACGNQNTASAVYVAIPGLTVIDSFVKQYPHSRLRISGNIAYHTGTSQTGGWLGCLINGVDIEDNAIDLEYNISFFWLDTASTHYSHGGTIYVPAADIPVGQYTITPAWRRGAGSGQVIINTNSWFSLEVEEAGP